MSSIDRKTKKGRFIGIPYHVAISEQFAKLRAPEAKLLLDLLIQYNGKNNGMLSPCHSLMKKRHWAKSSLFRAYSSLVHLGFLVVTRQGMKIRGRPTLVAITWNGIDEPFDVDYDTEIKVSSIPLAYWKLDKSKWKIKPQLKPPAKNQCQIGVD